MAPQRKRVARAPSAVERSRRTHSTAVNAAAELSGLLRLPAELGNNIYEYVLLEEDRIKINKNLSEPPILQVCRQIRKDARPMWYLRNHFAITVMDCEADNLMRFITLVGGISDEAECDLEVGLQYDYGRNLPGLLRWCRAIHKDSGIEPVEFDVPIVDSYTRVVMRALNTAKEARGLTWSECRRRVKTMLQREEFVFV